MSLSIKSSSSKNSKKSVE